MDYQVLLFYKYVDVANPEAEKKNQQDLFAKYNLTGRLLIAEEGINGTLEGTVTDTENYIKEMSQDERFQDIDWKRSESDGHSFPKAKIKVRPEIVSLKLDAEDEINPNQTAGKYITADELQQLYENDEEFYVVDMRNVYEQIVGHFQGAYLIPMEVFRELPEKIKEIEHLKHKKVVTTCTGGIRCEKASGFLVANGFTDVYQLYGGMQTYIEKYPGQYFRGQLYVFDARITWAIPGQDEIISHCALCGKPSAKYVDCNYLHCQNKNRHFIACEDCHNEDGYVFCNDQCNQKAYAEQKFFVN